MPQNIVVPALGESITEATITKWLKKKGDSVNSDEPVVELETDKVNIEVPSPITGVISEINSKDGETVQVGSILGSISETEEKTSIQKIEKIKPNKVKENIPADTEKIIKEAEKTLVENKINSTDKKNDEIKVFNDQKNEKEDLDEPPLILKEEPLVLMDEVRNDESIKNFKTEDNKLSPAVRRIVAEKKIDVNKVKGTGKDGRILKGDVINLMDVSPEPNQRKIKFGPEERIKMTKLRQTIAKRLKEAQQTAAMLTTFNEVDMSNIINMRKENQEDFQNKFGVKLGFMSFFVKASIVALKLFPAINAEIEDQDIIYKNYYNISIAVGTEKGLVVPVIKNADELSFADIEKSIKSLSDKAQQGKITIDDLQGGTFTISNGGVYGSMLSTPILNLPQSGVLGMHNITERPIVVDGEVKIRPVMYLALSYDHRIIDGKDSVSFLKTIKENLENPGRLLKYLNV
tara:strand:+ start:318 stop:1700 length:1383 start_codon:yes stop_codon:yes gene_type:complete